MNSLEFADLEMQRAMQELRTIELDGCPECKPALKELQTEALKRGFVVVAKYCDEHSPCRSL